MTMSKRITWARVRRWHTQTPLGTAGTVAGNEDGLRTRRVEKAIPDASLLAKDYAAMKRSAHACGVARAGA